MGRDEDLDKELRFHIEERVAELVAAGVTPSAAAGPKSGSAWRSARRQPASFALSCRA